MAETVDGKKEEADYKRLHSFPLIRVSVAYMISSSSLSLSLPPFISPSRTHYFFQNAARMIKESMDKKFGSSWHVVIGEGFGFEVTHEIKNLLYMFFGGSLAVCVWKCS
ncbi:Dynein light chain 4, axonemal [Triplophysa tibetana]|uniref:Dynein axonemal light chain 4 n=1 Tax=Triplophysa tibetana TaxID=1572043 RepID=A0A5A9N7S2_9TELE|nr:Dynein light chain 4, axonemal [Triplophysa tibetana]